MNKIVSKVRIIVDNSNGTHTELESVMPKEVSDRILCYIVGWKDTWKGTVREVEDYQEAEKEFLERGEKKKEF